MIRYRSSYRIFERLEEEKKCVVSSSEQNSWELKYILWLNSLIKILNWHNIWEKSDTNVTLFFKIHVSHLILRKLTRRLQGI